jgi:hypothetical protein
MREVREAANEKRREAFEEAVASGRLTVRQMTPEERAISDAHRAAAASRN